MRGWSSVRAGARAEYRFNGSHTGKCLGFSLETVARHDGLESGSAYAIAKMQSYGRTATSWPLPHHKRMLRNLLGHSDHNQPL